MPDFVDAAPASWTHRFSVSRVPQDGSPYAESFEFSLDMPLRHWGQVYTFTAPVAVNVQAARVDGRIVVTVSIRTQANVPCSRCLEPAGVAIIGELRYLYSLHAHEDVKAQRETPEADEDGDEDVIFLNTWEDEIDLGPLVWEVLITALPPAVLCSDACKGLCPQCGANLNKTDCGCKPETGDPRFEVLKTLAGDETKQ